MLCGRQRSAGNALVRAPVCVCERPWHPRGTEACRGGRTEDPLGDVFAGPQWACVSMGEYSVLAAGGPSSAERGGNWQHGVGSSRRRCRTQLTTLSRQRRAALFAARPLLSPGSHWSMPLTILLDHTVSRVCSRPLSSRVPPPTTVLTPGPSAVVRRRGALLQSLQGVCQCLPAPHPSRFLGQALQQLQPPQPPATMGNSQGMSQRQMENTLFQLK